ncbi:MAG TPA: hypothetical protein VM890_01260 [Longimicrobium sp.]|jgi:hypothetical protein|nr:hypothetical protein [Longimicrobium sp.]
MRRAGVAALALLSACGRTDGAGARASVRDSAGVRIVEVRGEAGGLGRWRLDAVPGLAVGGADAAGGIELFRVAGAHRLADGRLLVGNGGSGELVLVDPRAGGAVKRYGRSGRGPGEFVAMAGVWAGRGDTVWVYDMDLSRVTPFTPEGGFGSPVQVPPGDVGGLVTLRGRFADGAYLGVVVRGYAGPQQRTGPRPDSMSVVRVAPGTDPAPLARIFFTQSFVDASGGVVSVPFASWGVAAGWSGGYWLGETGRYELRRYDPRGRLEMVIRRQVSPVRVTSADVDRELARWTEGGRMDAAAARRTLAELPIPRRFPVFSRVVAAADGGLWVQDHPGGDEAAAAPVWTAFGADGRIAARVTLPRGAKLVEASAGHLVAIVTDEDGVEGVTLYRLQPAGRGAGDAAR